MLSFADLDALIGHVPARVVTRLGAIDFGRGSEALYRDGCYVSLEQAIAESADAYYQALLDSTHGWHEGTADPRT